MTHSQGGVFVASGMWDRVAGLAVPVVSQDCSVFIFNVLYSNKKSSFTLWPFEDEGTKIHWNVSNHKSNNTTPNPRIPWMLSVTGVHLSTLVIAFVQSWACGHTDTGVEPWLPPRSYCLSLQCICPAVILLVWWVGLSPLLVGVCILQHASGHCWCRCGHWSPGA